MVQRALRLPDTGDMDFALKLKRSRLLLALGHAVRAIEAGEQALEVAQAGGERALALIAMASGMRWLPPSTLISPPRPSPMRAETRANANT